MISRTGHFYKKHKKTKSLNGDKSYSIGDQKNSSSLKKVLDTFDPYMNIFFSIESIE